MKTKQDHIDAARKLVWVPAEDHGQLVTMRGYDNPSSHMHGWPTQRRMDPWAYPLIEIFCKHGVGHPMPESVEWCELQGKKMMDRHGCDGCCIPPKLVHNHGIDPSCKESLADGKLVGECIGKQNVTEG